MAFKGFPAPQVKPYGMSVPIGGGLGTTVPLNGWVYDVPLGVFRNDWLTKVCADIAQRSPGSPAWELGPVQVHGKLEHIGQHTGVGQVLIAQYRWLIAQGGTSVIGRPELRAAMLSNFGHVKCVAWYSPEIDQLGLYTNASPGCTDAEDACVRMFGSAWTPGGTPLTFDGITNLLDGLAPAFNDKALETNKPLTREAGELRVGWVLHNFCDAELALLYRLLRDGRDFRTKDLAKLEGGLK